MSFSDVSAVTNFFATANEGFNTTTSNSVTSGGNAVPLTSVSGLTNASIFVGVIEPGGTKEQVFTGTVDTAGSQITGVKWTKGTNTDHASGVTVVDYDTGTAFNMMRLGVLQQHKQSGAHGAVTADSLTVTGVTTLGGAVSVPTGGLSTRGLTNPYKFSVYRTAALNTAAGTAIVAFDTKNFDTGSNIDVVTNKGRFTAPVAGFYFFETGINLVGNTSTRVFASIYKNGATVRRGYDANVSGTNIYAASATAFLQLAAGDYIEVALFSASVQAFSVNDQQTSFSGFLVSAT